MIFNILIHDEAQNPRPNPRLPIFQNSQNFKPKTDLNPQNPNIIGKIWYLLSLDILLREVLMMNQTEIKDD